jgi:hypothetical protein
MNAGRSAPYKLRGLPMCLAGSRHPPRAVIGQQRLRRARCACCPSRRAARHAAHSPSASVSSAAIARQAPREVAEPEHVGLAAAAGQQLVDQSVGHALADLIGPLAGLNGEACSPDGVRQKGRGVVPATLWNAPPLSPCKKLGPCRGQIAPAARTACRAQASVAHLAVATPARDDQQQRRAAARWLPLRLRLRACPRPRKHRSRGCCKTATWSLRRTSCFRRRGSLRR